MSSDLIIARIDRYDPIRAYGFVQSRDGTQRLHFHGSVFAQITPLDAIPPIPGEIVEVEIRDLKAKVVRRLHEPIQAEGLVRSFDPNTGWGFLEGEGGLVYFLHRSDFMSGPSIPVIGDRAVFIVGSGGSRPRACAVRFIE